MDVLVKIEAPELVAAINTLATALESWNESTIRQCIAATTPVPQPVQTVAPTAPAPQPVQAVAPAAPAPQSVQAMAPAAAVPVTAQTYTLEQLAVAATQLVDAGRRAELVQLLQSFGVQALTMLPKEQYGAFATKLRAMGAKL